MVVGFDLEAPCQIVAGVADLAGRDYIS